jgi:hypothetical protein
VCYFIILDKFNGTKRYLFTYFLPFFYVILFIPLTNFNGTKRYNYLRIFFTLFYHIYERIFFKIGCSFYQERIDNYKFRFYINSSKMII